MRFRVLPTLRIATGLLLAVLLGVVGYHVLHWRIPGSSEALLDQADEKSWVNNWIAAEPLYRQAKLGFNRNHEPSKALYAHVSEIPAQSESSISVPAQLAELTHDLSLPQARDANYAEKALCRFANLVMRGHAQTTFSDTEAEIAEAVDFVVHVERQPGRRTIREVLRLNGYDRRTEQFRFEAVYGGETASISGSLNHV